MQSLVDAIRGAGAKQPIIVSGIDYANDLSRWLELMPSDAEHNLIAGFHLYNFNRCVSARCWDEVIAPVAARVPVVTTELGEDACVGAFIRNYMTWADAHDVSYVGWAFNAWDCRKGPALITDESGTPTPSGQVFRDHLLGRAR
jgi:hypothetical protein